MKKPPRVKVIKSGVIRREHRNICVFCGSSAGVDPAYGEAARTLAKGLTSRGIGLVYGGASVGLMGALADTVLAQGGRVSGVIPQALVEMEVAHKNLTELRVVTTMHERKKVMFDLSDGFLTLPGGFGTLDETFEILTWKQIRIHTRPLVLLNIGKYYDPLVDFLDKAVAAGFIKPEYRKMLHVTDDVDQGINFLVDCWKQTEALPSAQ